jgi:hypothetical protein
MKIYLAGNTPDRVKEEKQFRMNKVAPPLEDLWLIII